MPHIFRQPFDDETICQAMMVRATSPTTSVQI